MTERYTRLFSLPENLYAEGSPVIIAAGALLKDNQTGKVIAQLKMRNISPKPIKAAKVSIHPLDTVGNPLGGKIEYQYLDLNAARDEDFGQKAPVALADASTRSFTASVEEIVFADNSIWTATGEPWEVLDTPGSLRSIGDAELIKQYRLKYGNNCKNLPLLHKDLWYCACGELNRQGEAECHRCQKSLALLEQIDMDVLRKERDTRVAAENEQAEKEAAAAKAHAKKMGKIAAIVVPILVVLIVAAVIISNSVKKSILLSDYNNAITMMENGNYDEAITSFTQLGDYKDSANKLEECNSLKEQAELQAAYDDALIMMEEQQYDDAILAFNNLGTYSDASSKAEECVNLQKKPFYDEAISLAESGKIAEAAIAFGKLGDYADARDRSFALWDTIAVRDTIVLDGDGTAAAVKTDGSVVAILPSVLINQDDVAKLTDIVSISIGEDYILGLKENGTVVVTGLGFTWEDGRIYILSHEISDLTDVVAISAASEYVVVLKTDGTVMGFAKNPKSQSIQVADWENIVAISTAGSHTVGLKADGSVVSVGENKYGECNVSEWTDIVAISTGRYYTVGLKSDGTVVVTGGSGYSVDADGLRKLSRWTDIVAISAGDQSVAGLKSDGTVVAAFASYSKNSDAPDWTDIVAVVTDYRFIGLKADGTVVVDGAYSAWPYEEKFNWSNWYDIRIP